MSEEKKSGLNPLDLLVSIFKYSIATWVNFIIYGSSLLLVAWFIPADIWGQLDIFISTSTLIMNICILGLDQSFMRFFNEPPSPLDRRGLLGSCFGISALCLVVTGIFCFVVCPQALLGVFFSEKMPNIYVAYLFINAFMAMVGRYVNLVYRMSGSIKLYTLESVLMQFFTKVFFIFGALFSTELDTLVLWAVGGMTAFGLLFMFVIRRDITLNPNVLFTKANRQLLPYGLALMPTAVMLWLNSLFSKVYIAKTIGNSQAGVFSMVSTISNVVAIIQAGFATFWSAFIYANYKTEQEKIKQVHDYLTFVIVEFFCVLVIFEDIIFWILGSEYAQGITVFPVMVLVPVFLIISETTVYGISIAKKPIFDTIGIGLSVVTNILFCFLLAPKYQLYGVCVALCLSNLVMFVFRTVIAQKLYCSIPSYMRTTVVCCLLFVIAFFGTVWAGNFALKAAAGVAGMAVYVIIYRRQLVSAVALGKEVLGKFLKK
ncbi:MAG: lipopolysaccharide biosynthesis protein [Oscillospiraceae bacterium]|nr:lipopolysaccharide biosynthesis protein [Oscillospiraceae bacterium]